MKWRRAKTVSGPEKEMDLLIAQKKWNEQENTLFTQGTHGENFPILVSSHDLGANSKFVSVYLQGEWSGWDTGNGEELSCSQAEPGQTISSAVV